MSIRIVKELWCDGCGVWIGQLNGSTRLIRRAWKRKGWTYTVGSNGLPSDLCSRCSIDDKIHTHDMKTIDKDAGLKP